MSLSSVHAELSRRRRVIGRAWDHSLLRNCSALGEPFRTDDRGGPAQTPTKAPCDLASRRSLSQDRWPHGLSVARRRRRGRGPRCAGPGETEQAGSAETHAQAFEEIWLRAGGSGHGRFAILPRRRARSWDRASALHGPMAKQQGGEFASSNPTTRTQDAVLQERRISAKISLSACRHPNAFYVQGHLISAKTHRAFRAAAMDTWRSAVAAA